MCGELETLEESPTSTTASELKKIDNVETTAYRIF